MKLLFILLLSLSAKAEINDPKNILSTLDQYLKTSFEKSFLNNSVYKSATEDCTGSMCDTVHLTMKVTTDGTTAQIDTYVGTNTNPADRQKMESVKWDGVSGNALRLHLANLESYGFTIDLDSISQDTMTLKIDGESKKVSCYKVHFTGVNAAKLKADKTFYISSDLPGLAQVIGYDDTGSGFIPSVKKYRITDFKR